MLLIGLCLLVRDQARATGPEFTPAGEESGDIRDDRIRRVQARAPATPRPAPTIPAPRASPPVPAPVAPTPPGTATGLSLAPRPSGAGASPFSEIMGAGVPGEAASGLTSLGSFSGGAFP